MTLTRDTVLSFLKEHRLMSVATYGEFPWIASVFYAYDENLNLYFLSAPNTLHCQQIANNPKVAVNIVDSSQPVEGLKRGLQLWGDAGQLTDEAKAVAALQLWKNHLKVENAKLTYENIRHNNVTGRMYVIVPKRIKLFDQVLFKVEDGQEPVLDL